MVKKHLCGFLLLLLTFFTWELAEALVCAPRQALSVPFTQHNNFQRVSAQLTCQSGHHQGVDPAQSVEGSISFWDRTSLMKKVQAIVNSIEIRLREKSQSCGGRCTPSTEVNMEPIYFEKQNVCSPLFEKTKIDKIKQTRHVSSSKGGCDPVNSKAALDWAGAQLQDTNSIFWKECPDPCSFYYTFVLVPQQNGSCQIDLKVICGHPKTENTFKATIRGDLVCK